MTRDSSTLFNSQISDNMPVDSGNVSGWQTYCWMLEFGACAKLINEG